MLAVGELFVWARSARSQARSACVIARRRLALPPRGTKTSTPTAEGRWGAANLSAKPKVRRPPQARRGEAASYFNNAVYSILMHIAPHFKLCHRLSFVTFAYQYCDRPTSLKLLNLSQFHESRVTTLLQNARLWGRQSRYYQL